MKEPGINKMCEENDMELRARLDHKELTQSREEIKKIQIEVIEGEAQVTQMSGTGPEFQTVVLFEKTKLYDRIY